MDIYQGSKNSSNIECMGTHQHGPVLVPDDLLQHEQITINDTMKLHVRNASATGRQQGKNNKS